MTRKLNKKEMQKWRESMGGLRSAVILICQTLECSLSKAEKLASCRYEKGLSASEQRVLADLLKVSRDVLFPMRGDKAS